MKIRLLAAAIALIVPPAFALDGDPGMHDRQRQPKPAFQAVVDVLKREH